MIKVNQKTSYEGAVLCTREENYYDDSDFYAVVWDEEDSSLKKVYYASTSHYTYENVAEVDATPEVKAKAREWLFKWAMEQLRKADKEKAERPEVGKMVKVVKGRKVKLGTTGKMFWAGTDRWGKLKVGVATSEKKENGRYVDVVWTWVDNVEVINPESYRTPEEELVKRAEHVAQNEMFYLPFLKKGMVWL